MIDAKTKLCCLIGNPVEHSLSPQLHNAVYKSLGLNFVFLAFKVTDVKKALEGLKAIGIAGISITIPHKQEVLKVVDKVDKVAQEIGAANTIVNDDGQFVATNTDWIGALKALEEKTTLSNRNVALIGAGGAARAVAYGLAKRKAKVFVFNRTYKSARQLVDDFKLENQYSLSEMSKVKDMDIIINTTSVGMAPSNISLVSLNYIRPDHIVFDIIFKPRETKLIQYAKEKKATIVYGYKMLIYQALEQFKLFTGVDAPYEVMEKSIC